MNELQQIYDNVKFELIKQLKLDPIDKNVTIKLSSKRNPPEITRENIFDLGVFRRIQNRSLEIVIYSHYKDYLPFILRREAYYCFVPEELKNKDVVQICINQIVENDLQQKVSKEIFHEWKDLIGNVIIDREFVYYQLDELGRFFQLEATEPYESTTQFFFIEIRKNALLFANRETKDFYDFIFEHYTTKTFKALFREENVETLRSLIKIFYDKKSYLNLKDYYKYFTEFKQNNKINTDLSLRKFKERMRWINKSTTISPSYDPNTTVFGIYPTLCFLTFNPLIENYKIKKILFLLPFLRGPKFCTNGFITHFEGTLYAPKEYIIDFLRFINKLEESGYIIKKQIFLPIQAFISLNLNYLLDVSNINKIIEPKLRSYNIENEIVHEKRYYYDLPPKPFSVLEFLLLNRIQYFSITGLTFDKRIGTLNAVKDSLETEGKKHKESCDTFIDKLNNITVSDSLKTDFLTFLKNNKRFGSIYISEMLANLLKYTEIIKNTLETYQEISTISQLMNYMNKSYLSYDLKENILLQDPQLQEIVFKNLIPQYFISIEAYRNEIEKIHLFFDAINSCFKLLIFNINEIVQIVKNSFEIEKIYKIKQKRINKNFAFQIKNEITNEKIESTIEKFITNTPPIVDPDVTNTIFTSTFAKYYYYLLLENVSITDKRFKKLKSYFPKMITVETEDMVSKKKLTYISTTLANIKEKDLLNSALNNLFKDQLIMARRYMWRGNTRVVGLELRDIFEFHKGKFLYKEGLFEQLFLYAEYLFGNKIYKNIDYYSTTNNDLFWNSNYSMEDLVNKVQNRVYNEQIEYNLNNLNQLTLFRNNLKNYLLNINVFKEEKEKEFFLRYIDSIEFIPRLSQFGLVQYHLIIGPTDYNLIDLKLLLTNSFQEVNYPASIDPLQIIHIKYIFPYQNPNKSYLNWLVGSKKCICEYCLFHQKKLYLIKDFSRNLDKEGWNYSSLIFEQYAQNILFNPLYHPKLPFMREFIIDQGVSYKIYEPESNEFKTLSQIYSQSCIDIKSYLGTTKVGTIKKITSLLEKDLIFPYLNLKNLDFRDKVSLILPDINKTLNEKLIMIFSFFNVCNIFEIEGEFYIYGFDKEKCFENGLLIEIWFPHCELDEFFDVFDRLFEFFKIKYCMILTDMVEGQEFLKSAYGNTNFLKEYNPLKNLKWNPQDKKWMNVKLFSEKFEPIYPDLIPKNEN